MSENLIAIASFLTGCSSVKTLGIRASLGEYSRAERDAMLGAKRIFFPTPRFVRIFEAAGKETFPSNVSYMARRSRLVQEALFQFLNCPHPRTRSYFGRQKRRIPEEFRFPLRAMGPEASGAVSVVAGRRELKDLSERHNPLIVQEIIPYGERFRLIMVNYEVAGIQRRIPFRDVHGGRSAEVWEAVAPMELGRDLLRWVRTLARSVRLNDIAIEIGINGSGWQGIEFARPPLRWLSREGPMDRHRHIARLIDSGAL